MEAQRKSTILLDCVHSSSIVFGDETKSVSDCYVILSVCGESVVKWSFRVGGVGSGCQWYGNICMPLCDSVKQSLQMKRYVAKMCKCDPIQQCECFETCGRLLSVYEFTHYTLQSDISFYIGQVLSCDYQILFQVVYHNAVHRRRCIINFTKEFWNIELMEFWGV